MVAVKAICDPSGEKYGSISAPWVDVSRRAGPPLRETTHKSPAYSKATESRLTVGWRKSRVPCADATTEMTRVSSGVKSSFRMFIVFADSTSKCNTGNRFAPEERDVYSLMLSLLFGAPEERNVLVGSPTHHMFRS